MKNQSLFSIKLLLHVLWVLPLVFIISCKDKKDPEPKNRPPGEFIASVVPSDTSAILGWTEAIDPDGDGVKYAVILEGEDKATSLEATSYTINSLEAGTNYTGKIVAADGKGGFSEAKFSFETANEPNSVPEDFTVSTTVNANESNISWTKSNDSDGDVVKYDLELEGAIIKTDLTNLSHKLTDLKYNTSYTGKVIAKDGKGGIKEKSYSFKIGSEANNSPGDFTVSTAVNGNGAAITWTASTDPDGDAIKYDVELGGGSVKTGLTGLTHSLSDLDYSKTYSGKIIAKDGKGGSKEKTYSFTTESKPNSAPGDFTVSTNVDGNKTTISWTASTDPDGDVVKYDVNLEGSNVASSLTTTSHLLTDLEYNKVYNGKVIAKDGKGGITEKSYSFTTGIKPNNPPGNFTAKLDNLNGNTASISWTTATDPDGDVITYNVELNGSVEASGLTGNSTTLNDLLYSTNYEVTVIASDGNGGTPSDSFNFTTLAAPPEFPVTTFSNASNLKETHFENQGDFEFGLEFEPIKTGKITALGVKLCFGNYIIRIWDAASMTEIMKANVSVNNPDQSCNILNMVDISPVVVKKGVKYMVTVNANNWYNYVSTKAGEDILPVTKGNIKFTRYGFVAGSTAFPTTFQLTRFAGIAEFKFVPDN